MPPPPEPTGHPQSGRHPRCRRPPLGIRRPAPGVLEGGRHQQASRHVGSPGVIPTALPRAAGGTVTGPRAGASARAPLPCCGWRRDETPGAPTSRRLGTPATGRPAVCLSHGQRGSVSPATPVITDGGDACGAPTLKARGLSHSGTVSTKGGAVWASADADGSRGLPQSLGVIVHGGGA